MKICMISLYTENYKCFSTFAIKSFEKFCEINNFDLIIYDQLFDNSLHPAWNKLLAVKKNINNYDMIFWSDIDCLFVNKKDLFLSFLDSSLNENLICNSDWNGLCTSHFLIKNNEYNNNLIDTLLFLKDVKNDDVFGKGYGPKWEQNTIKALLNNFNLNISYFPDDTVLDFRMQQLKNNTFFCHFCALNNTERKVLMQKMYFDLFVQ